VPRDQERIEDALIVRFGCFALTVQPDRPFPEVSGAIVRALDDDSRVTSLTPPDLDPSYDEHILVYPSSRGADPDSVVTGSDVLVGVSLSGVLKFELSVPLKNQPTFTADETPPAEHYYVIWDRYSLMLGWQQNAETPIPRAGGQVIRDVLNVAAKKMQGRQYIQSCSPWCTHLFAHQELHIRTRPGAQGFSLSEPRGAPLRAVIDVHVPPGDDVWGLLAKTYRSCQVSMQNFYEMKNLGRRTLDIGVVIDQDIFQLMSLHYERAALRRERIWTRISSLRNIARWRRESRLLLARLGIALPTFELFRRKWNERRVFYDRAAAARGIAVMFEDHLDDEAAIEAFDTTSQRATLSEMSGRLDNAALIGATVAVAAAAIIGVVLGHFL